MRYPYVGGLVLALLTATGGCARDGDAGVEVVPGFNTRGYSQSVAVAIISPQPGEVVQNPVQLQLVLSGFELGVATPGADLRGIQLAEGGQHLHIIVDDEPYMTVYDADKPLDLGNLTPGPHAVRVIPSLQWHEGLKGPGAFEAAQFYVETQSGTLPIVPGSALLTFSRPMGTYRDADADSVLVDFHVRNAQVGPGKLKVRLTIDDTQAEDLSLWVPYYLVGLAPGPHTIRLELRDQLGRFVIGPYNRSTHIITVERDTLAAGPS
ncbi:MAG TPA: hypothetical protein VGA37_07775 [Gemmatimonadales bacterium]